MRIICEAGYELGNKRCSLAGFRCGIRTNTECRWHQGGARSSQSSCNIDSFQISQEPPHTRLLSLCAGGLSQSSEPHPELQVFPDIGVASYLKNAWEDATFTITSLNDRMPVSGREDLVVLAAPDPPGVERSPVPAVDVLIRVFRRYCMFGAQSRVNEAVLGGAAVQARTTAFAYTEWFPQRPLLCSSTLE